MARIAMQVDVAAPVEDVFAFVADFGNALHYMEHFQVFQPLTAHSYGPGARVLARGRLHGIPVSVELEIVGFVKNRRLVSVSRIGVRSVSEWAFEPTDGGTRVSFFAEFSLPKVPLAGKILGKLIDEDIKAGTRRTLENLKRVLERRQDGSRRTGDE